MQDLLDMQEEKSFDAVVVGFPDEEKNDAFSKFFGDWGFAFENLKDFEMIITKEDCRLQIRSTHRVRTLELSGDLRKPRNLFSISEIPEEFFSKAVHEFRRKDPRFSYRMSTRREDYVADMSCWSFCTMPPAGII